MSSDTERAIEEILNDLERQPLQDKRTFRAYINQPELISLSSTNAQIQSPPISPLLYAQYYNFTVNLPRPALDAKSLQLLKAVIPQAQCSIPDYSLVFPYYKLRTVPITADTKQISFVDSPTYENLYFIRLLPSFYKKEQLKLKEGNWGYNQTFNDYQELYIQLAKACIADLTFTPTRHYLPNETAFEFNTTENRFRFYGLNGTTEPVINTIPEWNTDTTYAQNDYVFYDLYFYRSIQDSNIGVQPTYNMISPWRRENFSNYYTTWSVNQAYNPPNVVQYIGIFYLCKQYNIGGEPPPVATDNWLNVSQFFATNPRFNSYLIAGYQDPNVDTLLKYISRISSTFERLGSDNRGTSIEGNLYVPQQTLARRLGFTWNGFDTINDANAINTILRLTGGIRFGSTVAIFLNRFRPVVSYAISLISEGEQELSETDPTAGYYTADGYCNLVYSSIISIYTTIVGTSTVDTQRNANLLAMIPMDCGNLGVAMVGNYIDNALTKIQGDLYSIYIELRDENGEPYYLTNNATTTLLIKLTY
jgi:hypothetical protein